MSDTYTVDPSNVLPGSSTNITVKYTSGSFTTGTTYTLKTNTGTFLASQAINNIVTTFNISAGTWGIAGDSSGNIYTNGNNVYSASGSSLGTFVGGPGIYITSCAGPNKDIIYSGGGGNFSISNVSARTNQTYPAPGQGIWGIVYNPSDGYVYGSTLNEFRLFRIRVTDGSYTQIFLSTTVPSSNPPGYNNFFQGVAIGGDGNLYCITRNEGSIWKFSTSGTFLGRFCPTLPSASAGVGLAYNSKLNCFYAQHTGGVDSNNVFQIPSSGDSYTTFLTPDINYIHWGSYFNPYTQTYYVASTNGTTSKITTVKLNSTATLTFSSNLLTYDNYAAQLYNGSTPIGGPITIFTPYPCFLKGSKILRFSPETYQDEYVPVETLRRGDLIVTADSGYKSIHSIGHRSIPLPKSDANPSNRLYKFDSDKCPTIFEPLYITGEHCTLHKSVAPILHEEVAKHMGDVYITENHYRVPAMLDNRAEPYDLEDTPATIWHFALENDHPLYNYGVYANGLLVESCSIWYLHEKSGMEILP